jgi:hypothetical protein
MIVYTNESVTVPDVRSCRCGRCILCDNSQELWVESQGLERDDYIVFQKTFLLIAFLHTLFESNILIEMDY